MDVIHGDPNAPHVPDPGFERGQKVVWAPTPVAAEIVRPIDLGDRKVYVVRLETGQVITCGHAVLKTDGSIPE